MSTKRPPRMSFTNWTKPALRALNEALDGNGHGVYDPFIMLAELPPKVVTRNNACHLGCLCRWHESDGSHKGSLTDSAGNIVNAIFGLYTLECYRAIESDLDLKVRSVSGRGTEARLISSALSAHCDSMQEPVSC